MESDIEFITTNPYDIPLLAIGVISGVCAGLIPGKSRTTLINRVFILGLGVCISWLLLQLLVDWAYNHPFNPADGAPRTFAFLFGWLTQFIWPILPTFLVSYFGRRYYESGS